MFNNYIQGRRHRERTGGSGGGGGGRRRDPPTFLRSKKKKWRQMEKRNDFKAEIIKRQSPRSKYHCFNHSTASRIRKFFLLANYGRHSFQCSMAPPHFEIHFAGPDKNLYLITIWIFRLITIWCIIPTLLCFSVTWFLY